MEFPRPAPTTIPIVLSSEDSIRASQPSPQSFPSSRIKVNESIHTIKSVDGASDTDTDVSFPKPTRPKTEPLPMKRADSPHFWKPTKASRARNQATKGKSSRKSTSSHDTVKNLFQNGRKNAESEEAATTTVQCSITANKSTPPDLTEIYVMLQYDALFPHCKAHGVFKNVVDANNKVHSSPPPQQSHTHHRCRSSSFSARTKHKEATERIEAKSNLIYQNMVAYNIAGRRRTPTVWFGSPELLSARVWQRLLYLGQ